MRHIIPVNTYEVNMNSYNNLSATDTCRLVQLIGQLVIK